MHCSETDKPAKSGEYRASMNLALPVLLFAALALQGCSVYQLNRLPDSSPLKQPVPIPTVGEFKHEPSRYVFPTQVDGFQRIDLVQYDTAGLDIAAGYNNGKSQCRWP